MFLLVGKYMVPSAAVRSNAMVQSVVVIPCVLLFPIRVSSWARTCL